MTTAKIWGRGRRGADQRGKGQDLNTIVCHDENVDLRADTTDGYFNQTVWRSICTLWIQMKLLLDIPNDIKPEQEGTPETCKEGNTLPATSKKWKSLDSAWRTLDMVSKLEPVLW